MKMRRPAVVRNSSRSIELEVNWNLPVKLDCLVDQAVTYGHINRLAVPILDAASALACARGEWYGQDDITPILNEVGQSFRIVSSRLFDDPNDTAGEGVPNPERAKRAQKCMGHILDYVRNLEDALLASAA